MPMLSQRRRVTLKDLAKRTGVSPTAVSYVLNDRLDRVRVSPETKERVLAMAKEMGYVPKLLARSMVTQKSYSIGVICSLTPGPMAPSTAIYYANALQGIEEVCKHVGYHCLYASCGLSDLERFDMPRLMKDGSVDGVIIVGHANSEVAKRIKAMELSCVQVGSNIDPKIGIERVYPDLNQGLDLCVDKLVSLGHRRIELLLPTGPGPLMHMEHFLSLSAKIKGLETVSGMVPEEWGTIEQGLEKARQRAGQANMPTAYICSPIHAEGLVRGFEEAGLRYPRDYSLIVVEPLESGELHLGRSGKRLNTLVFPIYQVAHHAAMKLFELLDVSFEPTTPMLMRIPCSLIEGQSCGPAPEKALRKTVKA
ncbi:MAG TPA: LacI family DNA-binding transcriptional regulator [Tepidisphaeraceae bacterium]